MGSYLSIPFVSRKVIQLEPAKAVINGVEVSATVTSAETVEKMPLTPVSEEPKDEVKEEIKEEALPKVAEPKVAEALPEALPEAAKAFPEALPKVAEALPEAAKSLPKDDPMVVDFPPVNLKIQIPEDPLPDLSSGTVDRIPEFQGNTAPSHAMKKYNRRHRKHQN